ncbi:MAG: site-2 protease family protein [Candidatus Aenigmatarchaeota archaeon]
MDLYLFSVLAFVLFLVFLIYRDRKNIEFHYLLLMRRTKTGIKILDKLAKPKMFWKALGTVGVFVAFFLMFEGFVSLIIYGQLLLAGAVKMPGLSFVFPSVKSEIEAGPGYLFLPFWFWIIIIISVIVPHETFHGIISRVEKIRVKSAGFLLLAILPGAFVEPDERQLKKSKFMSKLRIFASGSLANFLMYFFVFNITANLIWPYFVRGPIVLKELNATGPAAQAGLEVGMIISEINKNPIRLTYSEFLSGSKYLSEETRGLKPGDEITVIANNREFKIILGSNPENESLPYLGIVYAPITRNEIIPFGFIFQLLTWIWIINYAISVFNIMPIYPLDGGMMIQAIAEKISKKHAVKITYVISAVTLSILVFNFVAPFLLQTIPLPS